MPGRWQRGEGAKLVGAHKQLRVTQEAVSIERHQALVSRLELEAHQPTLIRRRTCAWKAAESATLARPHRRTAASDWALRGSAAQLKCMEQPRARRAPAAGG